jgi:hypothetical protein
MIRLWKLVPRGRTMKRFLALALASGALMLLPTAFAAPAMADTTVPVSMTFTEPGVPSANTGCTFGISSCGHGQVNPFGQATEKIVFFACGTNPECDVRTINLPGGTIITHEFFSNPTCPGVCQPNPGAPGGATLTDTIVSGTGTFANATGTLSGSLTIAGGIVGPPGGTVIKLSGTITLAP